MAKIIPARMPRVHQYAGPSNRAVQKEPLSDGANAFLAKSLVKIATGVLAAVATGDVVCYGQSLDPSHAAAEKWPEGAPFGEQHYPLDLADVILAVQMTNNAATFGASGPTWTGSGVTVGGKYGLIRPTSGDQASMQFLNYQNTTNLFFEIVALHPEMAVDDQNPLVLVKLLPAVLQVA